jgi:hypothetical protein
MFSGAIVASWADGKDQYNWARISHVKVKRDGTSKKLCEFSVIFSVTSVNVTLSSISRSPRYSSVNRSWHCEHSLSVMAPFYKAQIKAHHKD